MKKTAIITIFFIFLTNMLAAQQVTISGTQQRIKGSNAELTSQKVKVTKTMTIVAVTGHNNGFWITKNGKAEKAFWNDSQTHEAIGYKLTKGEYQVFPNIKSGENSATVTIKLQ